MNQQLRDRILRKMETLSDERGYAVLDYVEFLESKYAERPEQTANVFQRFVDGVEDSLRAGRVSATTIAETMGLLNKAMGVLAGVAAAGKSVASDVMDVATRTTNRAIPDRGASSEPPPPPPPRPPASSSPGESAT